MYRVKAEQILALYQNFSDTGDKPSDANSYVTQIKPTAFQGIALVGETSQ